MKRKDQVKKVCSEWHGGQWSALYQFASSGQFVPENTLRYLKELQECREPEYYLHPGTISVKDNNRLRAAQNFFTQEAKRTGIIITWRRHPVYGYMVPLASSIYVNVTGLKLLV